MINTQTTMLLAGGLALAVLFAVAVLSLHMRRIRASQQRVDEEKRAALARRQCNCLPRPLAHELRVVLAGQPDPLIVLCSPDEGHRAHEEITLQVGLYRWRTEFVYKATVSVQAHDGGLSTVVIPSVQSVTLVRAEETV